MKTNKLHITFALILGSFLASCDGVEIEPEIPPYIISGVWKGQTSKSIFLFHVRPGERGTTDTLEESRKLIGSTIVREDGSFKVYYQMVDTTRLSNKTAPVRLELGNSRIGRITLEPNENVTDIDR